MSTDLQDILQEEKQYTGPVHIYDINTKIVLATSGILVAMTIALFLILEWDNTLQGMTIWEKIAQAFFNSSVPRSSGIQFSESGTVHACDTDTNDDADVDRRCITVNSRRHQSKHICGNVIEYEIGRSREKT